ncbi:MAG: DUF5698 domain-containing protein [Oscillospiraceae bacterium]|nr:DUF5698 domain-containing protein [Oscillospiraceae bacterium]
MTELLHSLPQILTCLLICGIKIIEISVQSIRVIMQVKGQRLASTLLAFLECMIWGLVASAVITTLADNIYWLFAYCLGFAAGIYFGSILEKKLALGEINLQLMADEDDGNKIIEYLVNNGRGFTAFEGFGFEGKKFKINTVVPRKAEKQIVRDIHEMTRNVFVVSADIGAYFGGYGVRGNRK